MREVGHYAAEVGHYAAEVGHYVSSDGGIMLQVVDANAGRGALCFRGGALCIHSHRPLEA